MNSKKSILKKVVMPGVISGALMLVGGITFSFLFTAMLPDVATEYKNISIFRPFSDPIMSLYFLHPFVLGLILSWVWDKTKIIWSSESRWRNTLNFAICYWVLSLAGMLISFSTFQISLIMIISWTLGAFVQAILAGLVFSRMNPF